MFSLLQANHISISPVFAAFIRVQHFCFHCSALFESSIMHSFYHSLTTTHDSISYLSLVFGVVLIVMSRISCIACPIRSSHRSPSRREKAVFASYLC